MRIGLVTESFLPRIGGLEWKVHYLASEYLKQGHEAVVFAGRPYVTIKPVSLGVSFDYDLVRCSQPIRGIARLGLDRVFFRKAIMKHHRNRPFDILHCHGATVAARYGLDVREKTNLPVVVTTTGGDVQRIPEINYGNRLDPKLDRIVRDNLQKVDVIGSISSSVKADLESLKPAARIVDIPNGVDWGSFQVGPSTFLKEQLKLGMETILIISVGRNHIKKGYEYGIRAFASIAAEFKKACYAIVGRGTTELMPLVKQIGMTDRIKLVEQVPMKDMPYVYHSADIFFNPSLVEGFAQVNAQALACGLPCVLTDAPGNRDAGDYGGALIAKSENIDSMAEKLSMLLADGELRQTMGKEAYLASRNYAWSKIAADYLNIFGELIKKQ